MKYFFQCSSCGKKKSKEFPMGKKGIVICTCGVTMDSIISTPKFMLVGEGWAGKNRM